MFFCVCARMCVILWCSMIVVVVGFVVACVFCGILFEYKFHHRPCDTITERVSGQAAAAARDSETLQRDDDGVRGSHRCVCMRAGRGETFAVAAVHTGSIGGEAECVQQRILCMRVWGRQARGREEGWIESVTECSACESSGIIMRRWREQSVECGDSRRQADWASTERARVWDGVSHACVWLCEHCGYWVSGDVRSLERRRKVCECYLVGISSSKERDQKGILPAQGVAMMLCGCDAAWWMQAVASFDSKGVAVSGRARRRGIGRERGEERRS